MQHKASCDCYYCTKNQKAKQAQIAALSAERSALVGGAR